MLIHVIVDVLQSMLDTIWCKDCHRVVCVNHRMGNLHSCEPVMSELALKKSMSKATYPVAM